jgi:phosphoglycolate phosphatase-like HAD superfamily hydrolase
MRAVIFDIDHTLFDADKTLHDGVVDLLVILQRLGIKLGAISGDDHRALVRLDEAGISAYFNRMLCNEHILESKTPQAMHQLLKQLGVESSQSVLVSHAHADILLGQEAKLSGTIGVSHGAQNVAPLHEAGADYIVPNIPAILDVLG